VLSKYFWSTEKWISRCTDNTRRLWKTTESCRRARKCIEVSLITYPDSWSISVQLEGVQSMGNQVSG